MLVKITAISIIRPENSYNQNEDEECFNCRSSEVHPWLFLSTGVTFLMCIYLITSVNIFYAF